VFRISCQSEPNRSLAAAGDCSRIARYPADVAVLASAASGFYEGPGWIIAKRNVGLQQQDVYFRDADPDRGRISSPP